MRIDVQVEDRVRRALAGVIDRNGDAMVAALDGLSEEQAQHALGLALYAAGFVVNDVFRDGATDEELRALARQIVETESNWVTLDVETVSHTLRAAAIGDPSVAGVAPGDVVGNAFVSAGHLLGAFSDDDQEWWEYLNEVWAALAAEGDG